MDRDRGLLSAAFALHESAMTRMTLCRLRTPFPGARFVCRDHLMSAVDVEQADGVIQFREPDPNSGLKVCGCHRGGNY